LVRSDASGSGLLAGELVSAVLGDAGTGRD
jgi:hypothetical protein